MTPSLLVIVGCKGHGKKTVCELMEQPYMTPYEAFAMKAHHALAPMYAYESVHECLANRVHHMSEWQKLMQTYTAKNKGLLARDVFMRCRVYCGAQSRDELEAIADMYPTVRILWVEAADRTGITVNDTDIEEGDAHDIVYNNGTIDDLRTQLRVHGLL
jgi:hypothetical protein